MRVLFLDVDGVLNRTGYRPASSEGLRSWIEPALASQLNRVVEVTGARVVMSSDWRIGRELAVLRVELQAAGVECELIGVTPVLERAQRWQEIRAWMDIHEVADIAIVDDLFDMGPLNTRFVRASPLSGLDQTTADALIALLSVP